MSRKIIYCLFVLALVSTANAAPFMFGTWEDANNGYVDWSDGSITAMPAKYSYSTTGATDGSKALRMNAGIGWQQNLAVRSYEDPLAGWPNGIVNGFLTNQYLALDVTFNTADWTGSGWAQIQMNTQGTGLGWTGLGLPTIDTGNPGSPGGWDGTNFPGITKRTMLWDIGKFHDGNFDNGELTAIPTNGYVNFIMTTNSGGFTGGGVYYFDNMRFVPEPVTIALLGLGGLFLRRRK